MEQESPRKLRIKRINHIGVPISDRKRALPFYRDILGLALRPSMVDNSNIVWTETEEKSMVHLIEPSQKNGISPGWHVALEVENFDEAMEILSERGVHIADGPGQRHDGQRYVYLIDPDGNRIEITSASDLKPTKRVVDDMGRTTTRRR